MIRDVSIRSFKRGWIPKPPEDALVGIDAFVDCNNVRIQYGDVSKIKGWIRTAIQVLTGEIREIFLFILSDNTRKLVVITEKKFYEITLPNTATDRTDGTGLFPDNSFTINAIQFRGLFIFTNNVVNVKKWTGAATNIQDLAGLSAINITLARTLEVNNEFLILGNYVESGVRVGKSVVWCDRNAPETWLSTIANEAGDLDFDETPGAIVRIKKMQVLNVVYKDDSIDFLVFVGFPFIHVRRNFTRNVGLIGTVAVEERNGVHYFVGSDFDIYKFDGINLISLGSRNGIKDFILANIDVSKKNFTRVEFDAQYSEMRFIFPRINVNLKSYQIRFEIVYNIEEGTFSKRDSIVTASGHFEEAYAYSPSSSFSTVISQDAGDSPSTLFGVTGTPVAKEMIGDKDGILYYYNNGDSFDGLDYEGFAESGDENFRFLRFQNVETKIKEVSNIVPFTENAGKFYDVEFLIGVRDFLNKYIRWRGPFKYKPNYSSSGFIPVRASGVYHRYRFGTKLKNQPFSISGFILKLEVGGDGR